MDGEEQEPRNTGIGSDRVILHGVERTGSDREYMIDQGHPSHFPDPAHALPGSMAGIAIHGRDDMVMRCRVSRTPSG
jgi:hypothetical protein